jgi:valyl-tRNA synthetase
MEEEISKVYQPSEVESKWYARWLEANCFDADEASTREAYSIVIPPPNVTGVLHLGHVLNVTIQDVLARRARMNGKEVLWLPGTDHAGIATQTMVEKALRKEGTSRRELGREPFLDRVREWKDEHGGIIIQQLKRLGCSCDWSRERYTQDEDYVKQVLGVFVKLYEDGLIYRGKRMVNWCPVSQTALSDEEVIKKPAKGFLYYMRYEIAESPGEYLEIATTRPETLMGDTGVAVHPKDPRYAHLIGKHCWRPFPRKEIPIVGDEHIDMEFGTGVLKVTPAHDKADFDIGQRHGLEVIDVLNPDGTLNAHAGEDFEGMDRMVAREKAAERLEELGLLIKREPYENEVGYSERANVPIEPRLSLQWFLRYPKVEEAIEAAENGAITFRPQRWTKTYAHWMENIQDWCISRQLWWGHRIPVWYPKDRLVEIQSGELGEDGVRALIHVGTEAPTDGADWVQDEDVLDTWFSSWLWPFATMDEKTQSKFFPTTDLVTGPDIIFFWVARMIMASYTFKETLPFKNVFLTGLIRDAKGQKLSKTLKNSPDCLVLLDQYGADGVRFGLLRIAPSGSDIRYDEDRMKEGRNFATKLWNAVRFRQMQTPVAEDVTPVEPDIYALDILGKLNALEGNLNTAYDNYRFNDIANLLYEFFWSQFCAWYLESVKDDLGDAAAPEVKAMTLETLDKVYKRFLMLLHPFMPHLTEELWERLGFGGEGNFLMNQALGGAEVAWDVEVGQAAQERVAAIHEATGRARTLKAE